MQLKMAALQDGNPGQIVSNTGISLLGNMPVEDQFLAQNSQSKFVTFKYFFIVLYLFKCFKANF